MSKNTGRRQAIWIARHGNRADFADPGWRSRAERPEDPPLADDGVTQAQDLARHLVGKGIQRIFASPFHRTVQTASHVSAALDLPIHIEFGICECLKSEWFPFMPRLRSPEESAALFSGIDLSYKPLPYPAYPETDEDLQVRLTRVGRYLADKYADEDILIIGHGGTVCGMTNGFMGTEGEQETGLCCLTKIVRAGAGWELEIFADTSHLSKPSETMRLN